jgi:hypothetical protein
VVGGLVIAALLGGVWGVAALIGTQTNDPLGGYLIYTESLTTNAPYRLDRATREQFLELANQHKSVQLIRIDQTGQPDSRELVFDLTPRFSNDGDEPGRRTGQVINSQMGNEAEEARAESLAAIESEMNRASDSNDPNALAHRALYKGLATLTNVRHDLPVWIYSLGIDTADPVNFSALNWEVEAISGLAEGLQDTGQSPRLSASRTPIMVVFGKVAGEQEPLRCAEHTFRERLARVVLGDAGKTTPCREEQGVASVGGNPEGEQEPKAWDRTVTGLAFSYSDDAEASGESSDGSLGARPQGIPIELSPWYSLPCPAGYERDASTGVCYASLECAEGEELDGEGRCSPISPEPVSEECAENEVPALIDGACIPIPGFRDIDAKFNPWRPEDGPVEQYDPVPQDIEELDRELRPYLNFGEIAQVTMKIHGWASADLRRPASAEVPCPGEGSEMTTYEANVVSEKRAAFVVEHIRDNPPAGLSGIDSEGHGTCGTPLAINDARNQIARIEFRAIGKE